MAAGRTAGFYRYSENRPIKSDVSGFDEYIDAPEVERASVEDHIPEENNGYRLMTRLGWCKGRGLGKEEQGDLDPIPFRPKDDHMGIGRWQFELENAQDATEKRRQLEIEKEITPELAEKYKVHANKERKMAEVIAEMKKSFYCQLCDKQYSNYQEYDNHINSYSHAHNQRLKQLKEYEVGRRFGGRKDKEEELEKQRVQRIVAKERALMSMKRQVAFASGGMLSAFKPVGDHKPVTDVQSPDSNPQSTDSHSTTPTLYYPMITNTTAQSWEPTVLIKPHPPNTSVTTVSTITSTTKKATGDKVKVKKRKKKQVDHSGFVPRKIANTSSAVRNPLLLAPTLTEKKEVDESIKEPDDLFSLYDDFDVTPAVALPTDHICSSSIWDNFEATAVQQQQQSDGNNDSDESCDVSSEEEQDFTVVKDHVIQPITQMSTTEDLVKEVKEKNESDCLLQQPDEAHPPIEEDSKESNNEKDRKESRNERLLRLLGMPLKSFLSAGHQQPLKDHITLKATNSGSYLDKPDPSQYCRANDSQSVVEHPTSAVTQAKKKSPLNCQLIDHTKKPDGLSFGLSKKREKLGQPMAGHLFDNEDSPVEEIPY